MRGRPFALSEEGLARLLASDPFRALSPDQAEAAEELLRTGLMGENRADRKTALARIDGLVRAVSPADAAALRDAVRRALGA